MKRAARDNVIFEAGFFMGRYGRKRTFLVKPNDIDIHIPSDLLGVTLAEYDASRSDGNWRAATQPACSDIRAVIREELAES